jgi:hypothetical protein
MAIDYRKLTDEELEAIASGDLSKVSDDVLKELSAAPVSTVTGMTKAQAQRRAEAGLQAYEKAVGELTPTSATVARVGVPIAVAASLPISGPAALTTGAGLATAAMVGAGANMLGEAAGQAYEYFFGGREKPSGTSLIGAGYTGMSTPLPMKEASRMGRFLANASVFGMANEGEKVIKGEEVTVPSLTSFDESLDAATRLGGPALAGFLSMAPSLKESTIAIDQRKAQVIAERMGGGFIMSDLSKSFTGPERRAIAGGSKKVRQLLDDMQVSYGDAIAEAFKDAPNPELLAEQLGRYRGQVENANEAVARAKQVFEAKKLAAEQASATNAVDAARLREEASTAGIDVVSQEALRADRLDELFGTLGNDLSPIATNARKTRLNEFAGAVKKNIDYGIGLFYKRAGLLDDDIVANEADIYAWLDRANIGKAQRGAIRADIELALKGPDMKDQAGNISLGAYRMMRDKIADNMAAAGKPRSAAQRAAGNAYEAVRLASEGFLEANRRDVAGTFKEANKAARAIYSSREGLLGAVDLVERGEYGDLVKLFEREGFDKVIPEVEAYASAIRGLGDEASQAAANRFVKDFNLALRDTLVGESLVTDTGLLERGLEAIDVKKFVKRLSSFASDSGYPIESLGLGNKDSVAALARIASRTRRSGMTIDELNTFFDDVARVGIPEATARHEYGEAMRSFFLANTNADKKAAYDRAMKAQADAKLSLDEAITLYKKAESDPLAMLFNNRSFMVDLDQTKNGDWISKLLTVGEDDLGKLMRSLRDNSDVTKAAVGADEVARRNRLAEDISKSVTANLMFEPLRKATGEKGRGVDLVKLTDLFYGDGSKKFRTIVGPEVFDSLKGTWGKTAADMLQKAKDLKVSAFTSREDFIAAAGAAALAQGRSSRGFILGGLLESLKNAAYRGHYTTLYYMFGHPTTSKMFKDAAYDLDAFAKMNPRNGVLLQLAGRSDLEAERLRLEREAIEATQGQPTR